MALLLEFYTFLFSLKSKLCWNRKKITNFNPTPSTQHFNSPKPQLKRTNNLNLRGNGVEKSQRHLNLLIQIIFKIHYELFSVRTPYPLYSNNFPLKILVSVPFWNSISTSVLIRESPEKQTQWFIYSKVSWRKWLVVEMLVQTSAR